MTISSGFFNSVNHDRLYDAEQLSSIFDGIILDGVYENVGSAFEISSNPDANDSIFVRTGRAWFDHTWTLNDSNMVMTLEPPNEMLPRIDAVVIDVDRRESVRANTIKLVTGTLSSNPQPPTLIKEALHNQYPLAYITRPAGSSGVVSNSNIQNKVGTEDCPLVTGVLEMVNNDNFWQQLDSEFNEWWDGIKATLDENVATNLQNQIDALDDRIDEVVENGTVGDDGVIGDYQICLTKSQVNSMIKGTTGNTLTANSQSYYNFTNEYNTGSSFKVKTDSLGKGVFFLPDGWVCAVWFEAGQYNSGKAMHASLMSPEGVIVNSTSGLRYDMYSYRYSFCVGEIDASYYPVVIPVLATTVSNGNDYASSSAVLDVNYLYGTITITEEHTVNYALTHKTINTIPDGDSWIYGMCPTNVIVANNGDRISLIGAYDASGTSTGGAEREANALYFLRLTSDGTVEQGPKNNPRASDFDLYADDGAEWLNGYNYGTYSKYSFSSVNFDNIDYAYAGYTVDTSTLTITARGEISGSDYQPENYVTGSSGIFSTLNLKQGLKKQEVYDTYLKPSTTQEEYPCFLLYSRNMDFINGDNVATIISMSDGTEDILLHTSGNGNHVHRNPITTICVMENNLSFSGVTINKTEIAKSPNGVYTNGGITKYLYYIPNSNDLYGDSNSFGVNITTIGG